MLTVLGVWALSVLCVVALAVRARSTPLTATDLWCSEVDAQLDGCVPVVAERVAA